MMVAIALGGIVLFFPSLGQDKKSAVVATRYLDIYADLTAENVEVKSFPASSVPEGVACSLAEVVGKEVNARYSPGQFIFLNEVVPDQNRLTSEHDLLLEWVLIDNATGTRKLDSVQAGDRISLIKSGKQILGSARVWEVDHLNNRLQLLVTESSAELVKDNSGPFQIGEATGTDDL